MAMPKHGRGFSKAVHVSTILHYIISNLQNNSIKKKSTVKEKKVKFLGTWCPFKATGGNSFLIQKTTA